MEQQQGVIDTFSELVRAGGPVLIACVVTVVIMCGVVWLAYKFIVSPMLKEQRSTAKSNADAAEFYAEAAKAHAEASRNNARTSEANTQSAAHLERMMRMLFEAAVSPEQQIKIQAETAPRTG